MPKKKTRLDRFSDLTWNEIEEWAGGKIVSRGRRYQRQGLVRDLAVTDDGSLIAWVDGTERYATRVVIDEDGLPESTCTCPYYMDCKHGVAVVIEYLNLLESNRRVPKAKQDDDRMALLDDERWDDESDDEERAMSEDMRDNIDGLLKGKTKAQLIDLIRDLAEQHPDMARDLSDRQQLISGNTKALVARLYREIRDLGKEPGWRNSWNGEGYTPDYSGIRRKLETLVEGGHSDEVLALGRELVSTGTRQVEESHDQGETGMEIAACMPAIVRALDRSSLDAVDKLIWALDVLLEDEFELCEAFGEYLQGRHPQTAWYTVADRLQVRLNGLKDTEGDDEFSRNYERDRLSDWVVYALERAGRMDEIIPLCIAEAKRTGSYHRLVKRLVAERCYEDADHWIQEGIQVAKDKWPGIAAELRDRLREIRTFEKNWAAVAAIQVEEFVRRPSRQAFTQCKEASDKARSGPTCANPFCATSKEGICPGSRRVGPFQGPAWIGLMWIGEIDFPWLMI